MWLFIWTSVEGLSAHVKLENGLKFIIYVLSIHPGGLVVLWTSIGCPRAFKILSASEMFSNEKILKICI